MFGTVHEKAKSVFFLRQNSLFDHIKLADNSFLNLDSWRASLSQPCHKPHTSSVSVLFVERKFGKQAKAIINL